MSEENVALTASSGIREMLQSVVDPSISAYNEVFDVLHRPVSDTFSGKFEIGHLLWSVFIIVALQIVVMWTHYYWYESKRIPVRGKHLDFLSVKDMLFISFNKLQIPPFVYFFYRYLFSNGFKVDPERPSEILEHAQFVNSVDWTISSKTILQIPWLCVQLAMLFVVYDFFYMALHWGLHIRGIYEWIHKHHHHQKAPSRGNTDAVNVHPIEFFLGEYCHLLALFVLNRYLGITTNVLVCLAFLGFGGVLATLNHTRFDVTLSFLGKVTVFDSKAHDVHHRLPRSNYGQYTMLWDNVWGTFRVYDPEEKINASWQLDQTTGQAKNCKSKEQ